MPSAHAASRPSSTQSAVAAGTAIGAAALLGVVGILAVFQGIAAIVTGPAFVIGFDYVYKIDPTGWGWIHLLVGAGALAVTVGLFLNTGWAAIAGIVIAGLSIIVNFLWLPYFPWWSIIVIGIDVFIIWSISVWHRNPAVTL